MSAVPPAVSVEVMAGILAEGGVILGDSIPERRDTRLRLFASWLDRVRKAHKTILARSAEAKNDREVKVLREAQAVLRRHMEDPFSVLGVREHLSKLSDGLDGVCTGLGAASPSSARDARNITFLALWRGFSGVCPTVAAVERAILAAWPHVTEENGMMADTVAQRVKRLRGGGTDGAA
jgi:hypothetical protein